MGEYRASVVGESFTNDDGSSRQREIKRCSVGEAVSLERDPANPHDSNCVKVISARGIQIGNIPRSAGWIAERLDAERTISAEIESVGKGEGGTLGVVLRVVTDIALPGSVEKIDPSTRRDLRAKPEVTIMDAVKGCAVLIVLIVIVAFAIG